MKFKAAILYVASSRKLMNIRDQEEPSFEISIELYVGLGHRILALEMARLLSF